MSGSGVPYEKIYRETERVYRPPLRRPATWCKIRQALEEFHRSGLTRSDRIGPGLIATWLADHPDREPVTAYALLRSFRSVCTLCRAHGWLRSDPFQYRKPAAWLGPLAEGDDDGEPTDRHRTVAEIRALLDLVDAEASKGWKAARLRALVYTFAYTGLRKNEALHLRWEDVDLAGGWLRVRSRRSRPGAVAKTRGSRATLALAGELQPVLKGWSAVCGSEWVFPGIRRLAPWTGGPKGAQPLDEVKAAGLRAGIAGLTILDFRHTIGTLAEAWGLSELELMRWLRHTRPSTQKWYRKVPDAAGLRATAAKIKFDRGG